MSVSSFLLGKAKKDPILFLVLIAILYVLFQNKTPTNSTSTPESSSSTESISSESSPSTNTLPTEDSREGPYKVVYVVDGDTLDVDIKGKITRLRLIGLDTPETVDPRRPVECFGKEASNKAKALLEEKNVYLEKDTSQSDRDKYDRLLRYVFFEDGTNFNEKMIFEGYGHEYTYDEVYKYHVDFKIAEETARLNKRGLWADGACD